MLGAMLNRRRTALNLMKKSKSGGAKKLKVATASGSACIPGATALAGGCASGIAGGAKVGGSWMSRMFSAGIKNSQGGQKRMMSHQRILADARAKASATTRSKTVERMLRARAPAPAPVPTSNGSGTGAAKPTATPSAPSSTATPSSAPSASQLTATQEAVTAAVAQHTFAAGVGISWHTQVLMNASAFAGGVGISCAGLEYLAVREEAREQAEESI